MSGVARYLSSWLEGYIEYTDQYNSPEIFRRWVGLSIIAAAMERKVWVVTTGRQLFPNMYILLAGPPGVGKTEAVRSVHDFLNEVDGLHMAATDVSSASLYDEVYAAERKIIRPTETPPYYAFHATTVSVTEFGVFLKQYDNTFMSKLNDLFDGMRIKEKKRGLSKEIVVDRPLLNLIAGTTPAWLGQNLPVAAWSEGFASRLIVIYSGEAKLVPLFGARAGNAALEEKLIQDLRMIANLFGQMQWEEAVQEQFSKWYGERMPPQPEHPRLEHYSTRRPVHLIKLMMAYCASRGNDMTIRVEDYANARATLLEAEMYMPDIFKSMAMSADSSILDETFSFVFNAWTRENNKPVKKHRIINFLKERAPIHAVARMFEVMEQSHMIKVGAMEADGNHGYVPIPRAEHGR